MIRSALGRRAASALSRFALTLLVGAGLSCTVPLEPKLDSSRSPDGGPAGRANLRGGGSGDPVSETDSPGTASSATGVDTAGAATGPGAAGTAIGPGAAGTAGTATGSGTAQSEQVNSGGDLHAGAVLAPALRSCTMLNVSYQRLAPTIVLVVGSSASMLKPVDSANPTGPSRWTAMRNTLLKLVRDLQDSARVGLVVVGGPEAGGSDGGVCADSLRLAPVLNNANAIEHGFPAAPPWSRSPSAIEAGVEIAASTLQTQTGASGLLYLLVATDSEPTTCESENPNEGMARAAASLTAAYQQEGASAVLLAISDELSEADLSRLTMGSDTSALGPYRCTKQADCDDAALRLSQAFKRCVFRLNNDVDPAQAGQARVTLNGNELAYRGPNGWKLNAAAGLTSTGELELVGNACQSLPGADLRIQFPCSAIVRDP